MNKYAKLWNVYNSNPFRFNDYIDIIKDDKETTRVVLSKLNNFGWLAITKDKEDSRKAIYRLKRPEQIMKYLGGSY